MAPKKTNTGRGRRSKTPGQTSESDPNPTAASPSASTPTGDATTARLLPSSSSPSAPRTTTATTQLIPLAPSLPSLSRGHHHPAYLLPPFFHPNSQITFLLPSSASPSAPWTTTTQLIPLAPPVPNLSWGHHHPAYPLPPFFHPTPQITSLLPSSASPSAPWTSTTQLIPLAPPVPNLSWGHHHPPYPLLPFFHPTPQITSLLPSSPPQITPTTQPLPLVPPLPIRKTHQERVSCTSDGATTTDHAGPSTAPSASAASTDDFMSLFAPAVEGVMEVVRSGKKEHPAGLLLMVAALYGLRLDEMESILKCLVGLAEKMKGDAELKAALEALADVEVLESTARAAEIVLAERKKRDGSGGSCSGSKGAGGGPDSGSGEGDGEGGGVSV